MAFIPILGFSKPEKNTIIPMPEKVEMIKGKFYLSNSSVLIPSRFSKLDSYLQHQILLLTSIKLNIEGIERGQSSILKLTLDAQLPFEVEEYNLNITPNRCEIIAKTDVGLFYGIQSLLQLLPSKREISCQIPCQKITDKPRFAWRGMMLDVSRHFFPKEFILKFLDLMAIHKMNVFHWHLVDDQGWRIEIRKYPMLTTYGAWR